MKLSELAEVITDEIVRATNQNGYYLTKTQINLIIVNCFLDYDIHIVP